VRRSLVDHWRLSSTDLPPDSRSHEARFSNNNKDKTIFAATQRTNEGSRAISPPVALAALRSAPASSFIHVKHGASHLKLVLGDDQVAFVLPDDHPARVPLNGIAKRSLETPDWVEIKPSPLGGLGLFTTKDCAKGDLLLSDRPMVSAKLSKSACG
jgi:hypothetical protein